MDDVRIAQPACASTREDRWRAIRERASRGLLLYNAGPEMLHLEGDLWAVAAAQGGYYRVDLETESCTCPDFEHYGLPNDTCGKHLFVAAIAHATRRAPRRPCACIDGWVYLGVEEDGIEHTEAVRCRRCTGRAL